MTAPPLAQSTGVRFLWHHLVHERWAGEQLYYWRLAFHPKYDRLGILTILLRAFQACSVLSYAVYEVAGIHDIILRVWLPRSCSRLEFESLMKKELAAASLQAIDVFIVHRILMHWVFDNERGGVSVPRLEDLAAPIEPGELQWFNSQAVVDPAEPKFADAESRGLVGKITKTEGVKFFVVIPHPDRASAGAEEAIIDIVSSVVRELPILERSLYEGIGFGQLLIMGRVEYSEFDQIRALLDKINQVGLGPFFSIRTYTHLCIEQDFLAFQERLPIPEQLPSFSQQSVQEYLAQEESEVLEFKASAFVDWARWLNSESDESAFQESRPVTDQGVVKAVVGMLNSVGGQIIIGALEPYSHSFRSSRAQQRMQKYPAVGNFVVCGIEPDQGGKNWDAYQNRLQQVLRERIVPAPSMWIQMRRVEHDGFSLAVVTVQPQRGEWFYLKDDSGAQKFYVRQGNSTNELRGPEADQYKRAHPRS